MMDAFCPGTKNRHEFETRCQYCGRPITDLDVTFKRSRKEASD